MPHYPCGVERNSNADKLIIIIYVWTFPPPVLPPRLPRGKTSPASTFNPGTIRHAIKFPTRKTFTPVEKNAPILKFRFDDCTHT